MERHFQPNPPGDGEPGLPPRHQRTSQVRRWRIDSLLCGPEPHLRSRRAGDRLLDLVAGLPQGSSVSVELSGSGDGEVALVVKICSEALGLNDLVAWVWQDVATLTEVDAVLRSDDVPARVLEVRPAFRQPRLEPWDAQEETRSQTPRPASNTLWPVSTPTDGMRLLSALSAAPAVVRLHLAPCRDLELAMVNGDLDGSVQADDSLIRAAYLGTPVEARLLVGVDALLSPRIRAALMRQGVGLMLQELDPGSPETADAWAGDPEHLVGMAKPFGLVQCLTALPACGPVAVVCGIPTALPEVQPVPLADDVCETGFRLGSAVSGRGRRRDVRLDVEELLLHMQVMGATGSGKSSFLAGLVREATSAGFGVTALDPHGKLVDRLLDEADARSADRFAVVRSGDAAHPVPINPLAGPDPDAAAEAFISVVRELHDPGSHGFLGPVWERGFATLLAAQRALVGDRANAVLMPVLGSDQALLKKLVVALKSSHPEVSRDLATTFADRRPDDFAEFTTWLGSKFQRLVGSPHMRGILGSGEDRMDVTEVLDRGQVLLVDLASPAIGDLSAQFLGELWLIKHWIAMSRRRDTSRPHLLIVDEAHLFASGLLARVLTQGRKFGLGAVVVHQNLEQLSPSLREAVLSSTNHVLSFRTGLKEEYAALERLGSWDGGKLTRLPRLTAATTLNTGHGYTDPFTLTVDHNDRVGESAGIGDQIEARSRRRHATTPAATPPLGHADITAILARKTSSPSPRPPSPSTSFLDEWLERRKHLAAQSQPTPAEHADAPGK